MFDATERRFPMQREQRLLLAVLEEAIWTYRRYAHADDHRGVALFTQVKEWFASEDSRWMFSFVAICDTLGFETAYLRSGLRRWRDSKQATTFPFRRVSGTRHHTTRRVRPDAEGEAAATGT